MLYSFSAKRQLLILISLYVVFSFMATSVFSFLPNNATQISTKLFLAFFSIVSYIVPVWLVRKLTSAERKLPRFEEKVNWKMSAFLLSITAMTCSIIVMNWLSEINQHLPLPDSISTAEMKAMESQRQYMKMGSYGQFAFNLLIFSLVPSICEELFFRGAMQPLWIKSIGNKWLAVIITAAIFSFFHFQFLGFLPRLFAGVVLGLIFLYTGNIVLAIVCHFIYNSSVVVFYYADQRNWLKLETFQEKLLSPLLIVVAVILIIISLFLLYRYSNERKVAK